MVRVLVRWSQKQARSWTLLLSSLLLRGSGCIDETNSVAVILHIAVEVWFSTRGTVQLALCHYCVYTCSIYSRRPHSRRASLCGWRCFFGFRGVFATALRTCRQWWMKWLKAVWNWEALLVPHHKIHFSILLPVVFRRSSLMGRCFGCMCVKTYLQVLCYTNFPWNQMGCFCCKTCTLTACLKHLLFFQPWKGMGVWNFICDMNVVFWVVQLVQLTHELTPP